MALQPDGDVSQTRRLDAVVQTPFLIELIFYNEFLVSSAASAFSPSDLVLLGLIKVVSQDGCNKNS